VAAGLTAALAAAGLMSPALAAHAAGPAPTDPTDSTVKSAHGKLGSDDVRLLSEAKARKAKNVTMMVVTAPGRTEQVVKELDAVKGGSVGRTYDKLGYVRATVPTRRADSAIAAAVKLSSVHGIDLRDEIPLKEPGDDTGKARASTVSYPGPGKNTAAANPYNPSYETGAVDFVKQHPKTDGRGVTIGILDSGVDLANPALQKTTTGERKIVDWVTATDPVIDGDGSWLPMTTSVTGPVFTYDGKTWKAPRVRTGSTRSTSPSPRWARSRTATRTATSIATATPPTTGVSCTTPPPARSLSTSTTMVTSPTTPR
jgi:hypothetical protein